MVLALLRAIAFEHSRRVGDTQVLQESIYKKEVPHNGLEQRKKRASREQRPPPTNTTQPTHTFIRTHNHTRTHTHTNTRWNAVTCRRFVRPAPERVLNCAQPLWRPTRSEDVERRLEF